MVVWSQHIKITFGIWIIFKKLLRFSIFYSFNEIFKTQLNTSQHKSTVQHNWHYQMVFSLKWTIVWPVTEYTLVFPKSNVTISEKNLGIMKQYILLWSSVCAKGNFHLQNYFPKERKTQNNKDNQKTKLFTK